MRILFFGSGAFGLPTLERLWAEHSVEGVVTQPDRPAGRRMELTPTPVGARAAERTGVRVLKPASVNEPTALAELRAIPADAWVVIAFGQKLGPALLEGRFAINLHASLLPRWRGAAPINHAILAGDAETGVSVITLADRMDAGLILGQSSRPIDPLMTAGELHDRLSADGPDVVERVLAQQASGALRPVPQDEAKVTQAPKLSKTDGWVDFRQCAELCRRRIHGLTPWPGVTVTLAGEQVKLRRVQAAPAYGEQPRGGAGALVDPAGGVVACGDGSRLRLLEVQPAGGRPMKWAEFARGRRLSPGLALDGGAPC